MPVLLIVGGGLFGSLAAAQARSRGIETLVFDDGREGAASPAAAGLIREAWTGKKLRHHFLPALRLLEKHYAVRTVTFSREGGGTESLLFVPPSAILDPNPVRERVTAVGNGWLECAGRRYEGWVYVAAGVWCPELLAALSVHGKAGAAFLFPGEHPARLRPLDHGRQALAFVRDPGTTYFSDGTAEREYTLEHDRRTLERAEQFGLHHPVKRLWGWRPYAPGGPVFERVTPRTWVGTGGRKLGTILGAAFARQLIEEELHG